ncbi:MAG TPA: methylmalonyl-CoA mutase family protein, partial [Planctomycetota bacterium]|nr:methylmalonyl-CoA mutase family protein [Planctomycetota bacterium]
LQLEKEALLARADIVVMNKCDYPQAEAKARRVRQFVGRDRPLYSTQANRHDDPGTTALFAEICRRSGLEEMAERLEAPESAPREAKVAFSRRAYLAEIVEKHEAYYREMNAEIEAARKDPKKAETYRKRFEALRAAYGYDGEAREDDDRLRREDGVLVRKLENGEVPVARETTCGIWVPVVGMPPRDADTSEIIRYLYKQNAPGSFPFTEGAYPFRRSDEDPIRMFAGLGLPETTNARFHLLAKRGGAPRLSTAFDSLTLYGLDSDEPGALAKVGEGGVAVDSIEDMLRLYDGFDLERTSVSMTINGPAPAILALYLAAARKRGAAWEALRGTIQTDILKEVQAQNECIFPLEPSLRLIGDMIEFTIGSVPRWHPISISGYHIGEAGANPIQELAFTLANGFTYVEILRERGLSPEEFTKR